MTLKFLSNSVSKIEISEKSILYTLRNSGKYYTKLLDVEIINW